MDGSAAGKALGDVDVQYVWRFLPEHNIDLSTHKSCCESNDPEFVDKAADVVGVYVDPPAKWNRRGSARCRRSCPNCGGTQQEGVQWAIALPSGSGLSRDLSDP